MNARAIGPIGLIVASAGCLPSQTEIDPASVVDVQVRPASGQPLFCPGDPFQVEVIAKLKDGSSCSNVDAKRGCMGESHAVIKRSQVGIDASPGDWVDADDFVFRAPENPLTSARTGLALQAWIESDATGRSNVKGDRLLSPVYECQMQRERVFVAAQPGTQGENGAAGPDIRVSVTSLSTPWYPNAALVRVAVGNTPVYFISPSADKPIRIVTRGQDGAIGPAGAPGQEGAPGAPAEAECAPGADGQPGTDGGPGGKGGDGGPGGKIKLEIDDAKMEELRARVVIESVGGAPGAPGPGGAAGPGGKGGAGGPAGQACMGADLTGKQGALGNPGAAGTPGQAGAPGPAAEIGPLARAIMFAGELALIQEIEAAPRAAK